MRSSGKRLMSLWDILPEREPDARGVRKRLHVIDGRKPAVARCEIREHVAQIDRNLEPRGEVFWKPFHRRVAAHDDGARDGLMCSRSDRARLPVVEAAHDFFPDRG